MTLIRKRRCRHCNTFFLPDYRNIGRQQYCSRPDCRKASKASSQRRWLANTPDYFKGWTNVERVRQWRKANPGAPRRKGTGDVLQDPCLKKSVAKQADTSTVPLDNKTSDVVLQDLCLTQDPVFLGLIAHLAGSVLQDDIVAATRRLEHLGRDVLMGPNVNQRRLL